MRLSQTGIEEVVNHGEEDKNHHKTNSEKIVRKIFEPIQPPTPKDQVVVKPEETLDTIYPNIYSDNNIPKKIDNFDIKKLEIALSEEHNSVKTGLYL